MACFQSSQAPSWISRYLCGCKEAILSAFRKPMGDRYDSKATRHSEHTNNPNEFVRAHIYRGMVDMAGFLLGFAVVINSLILIFASSVFYYGDHNSGHIAASLFDAYDLIRDRIGLRMCFGKRHSKTAAAKMFAVALLCSGQSSSIFTTVAGQVVCEGFLQWRISPVVRRLLTRLLAIVPSMTVAVVVGRGGIDNLLVASQVVLSIVLPFIIFPLLFYTASKSIMSVKKTRRRIASEPHMTTTVSPTSIAEEHIAQQEEEMVDYSNNMAMNVVGGVIWLVIAAANVYALVELGMSKGQG